MDNPNNGAHLYYADLVGSFQHFLAYTVLIISDKESHGMQLLKTKISCNVRVCGGSEKRVC